MGQIYVLFLSISVFSRYPLWITYFYNPSRLTIILVYLSVLPVYKKNRGVEI